MATSFTTVITQVKNHSACMTLPVRFDHHVYSDFKDSFTPLLDDAAVHEIELDLSWTAYIDSSGLGMLLQLRENANRANKRVSLLNVSGVVLKVFNMANLNTIFNIHPTDSLNIEEKRSLGDRRAVLTL